MSDSLHSHEVGATPTDMSEETVEPRTTFLTSAGLRKDQPSVPEITEG